MRLILASASPARLTTLRAAGLDPEAIVSDVDERAYHGADPPDLVRQLAEAKAEAVFAHLTNPTDVIVVGCDSVLDFDGRAEGKPGSPEAARALLRRTRGHAGTLATGHHVIVAKGTRPPRRATAVGLSLVQVADISDDEIDAYVATGEPIAVAGGFTIDGLGGAFIDRIEGDPHNVVGLSLPLLRVMLGQLGVRWTDLWLTRRSPDPAF